MRSIATTATSGRPPQSYGSGHPWFEDQPGWTTHDAGASRFDNTVRLPGRVRRELGHVDQRGQRRIGVLVVEFDPWVPVTLAAGEPMPA